MRQPFHIDSPKKPIASRFLPSLRRSLLASGLLMALPLWAQSLTLSDAVSLTLRQHPDMAAFEHRLKGKQGEILTAGATVRPEASLTVEDALGTGAHSGFGSAQTTLSIGWLWEGDLIGHRVEAAQAAAGQVEFEKRLAALDLAAETAELFIKQLVLQERLQLAKLASHHAKQVVSEIQKRVKAGKSPLVDLLLAKAELARRDLAVDEAAHDLQSGLYQLAAQWQAAPEGINLVGALTPLPRLQSPSLRQLDQHPALLLYSQRQALVQKQVALAKAEAKPRWQFSGGLRRFESTDDFGLVAGISVPLGEDRRGQGRLQELRAQQAINQSEAGALKHRLGTELHLRLEELNHSRHVIDTLTQQVIPTLDEALKAAQQAYEKGQIGYPQWTTAHQQLLDAQSQLLNSYQSFHLRHIEIQRLAGTSLSEVSKLP